ncbi:MAG: DUF1573 domain-containing protein [Roseibacillus sp.]
MKRNCLLALGLYYSLATIACAGGLKFEKTIIEVLAEPDQETVTADFKFKSSGSGPAEIKRYDAPCSCLEAQISDGGRLKWEEGEEGTVRGLFKVGNFRGTVDKQISILMVNGARHDLTVRMTMPELLKIEPKTLKWEEGTEPKEQAFLLTISDEYPLEILKVSGTNEGKFPFKLETIEKGKIYRLSVTPSETDQRGFGLLRITTNSAFKKHKSYQAYAVVTKGSLMNPAVKK